MNLVRRKNPAVTNRDTGLDHLQRNINRLFDLDWDFDRDLELFGGMGAPAIDLVEEQDNFVVTCDLPGVNKDDLDISVSGNALTIKGEKKDAREEKEGRYYRRETWSGSFQRTITLPETVDPNRIDAEMKNGVLTLTLPKREEVKPRQIDIKVQ